MKIAAPTEPTKGVLRIPKPPQGEEGPARVVGQTPNGQNIYEREITEVVRDARGRVVQDPVLDHAGEPIWFKHPTTGVPIRPKMRNRKRKRTQRFLIQVETNQRGVATGTHTIVEYSDRAKDRQEAREHNRKVRGFNDQLISAAVERGLSPEDLLNRILAGSVDAPEGVQVEDVPKGPRHPVWDISVRAMPVEVEKIEDSTLLEEYLEMEQANPDYKGGRDTAIKAIRERLAAVIEIGTEPDTEL